MADLKIPLDFERRPEYWALRKVIAANQLEERPSSEAEQNDQASLAWLRLWVTLGYLAQSTGRPGYLNALGREQLGAHADLCVAAGLLTPVDDGWECELFAGMNEHLSPTHVTGTRRANLRSAIVRGQQQVAQDAMHQGLLLGMTEFKRRDGQLIDGRDRERCIKLVLTLDRCLKAGTRRQATYTPGLMADAAAVVDVLTDAQLQPFYFWLTEAAVSGAVPETAEGVLREWETVWGVYAREKS